MTHKQRLAELLVEMGVGFKEEANYIVCDNTYPKVEGYTGFYTVFKFEDDGSLIEMGAFE